MINLRGNGLSGKDFSSKEADTALEDIRDAAVELIEHYGISYEDVQSMLGVPDSQEFINTLRRIEIESNAGYVDMRLYRAALAFLAFIIASQESRIIVDDMAEKSKDIKLLPYQEQVKEYTDKKCDEARKGIRNFK